MRVERELGYPSQKLSSIDFCRILPFDQAFIDLKFPQIIVLLPEKMVKHAKFSKNLRKITTATKDLYYFNLTYEGGVLTVLSTFQVGRI